MKTNKINGLMICMAFCAVVFVAQTASAAAIPYSVPLLTDFLNNGTYFNGYSSLITSKDFSGQWRYTAIASEAANQNISISPDDSTSSQTFDNNATGNWGSWVTVNFDSGNIYFKDVTTQSSSWGLDPYASSANYFRIYQLTAASNNLSYLAHPLILASGTYIVGFNDNGSTDTDYDDLVIAMQPGAGTIPTPEPASLLLLGTGLGVIGLAAWRRKK